MQSKKEPNPEMSSSSASSAPVVSPVIAGASIVSEEIAHFNALAGNWWDPRGPMAPLHAMNPLRTSWIRSHLPHALAEQAMQGEKLHLLDIGCGAGLASEAFARLGFDTTGIDAGEDAIAAAREHQRLFPLPRSAAPLTYRHGAAEELREEGRQFDIVSALEVIEHVRDPLEFMRLLADLTRSDGVVAVSTLNRTVQSFLLAKMGAEYLLRLLPVGTHDWKKFIRPVELDQMAKTAGLTLLNLKGMVYSRPYWKESTNTAVNYIALFGRRN